MDDILTYLLSRDFYINEITCQLKRKEWTYKI